MFLSSCQNPVESPTSFTRHFEFEPNELPVESRAAVANQVVSQIHQQRAPQAKNDLAWSFTLLSNSHKAKSLPVESEAAKLLEVFHPEGTRSVGTSLFLTENKLKVLFLFVLIVQKQHLYSLSL